MNNRTEQDKRETIEQKFPKQIPQHETVEGREAWAKAKQAKSLDEECRALWLEVYRSQKIDDTFKRALNATSVVEKYRETFSK